MKWKQKPLKTHAIDAVCHCILNGLSKEEREEAPMDDMDTD